MSSDDDNYDPLYASDRSAHTIVSESEAFERNKDHTNTDFMKGCAISMWQNSGDEDSQWTRFTQKTRCCGLESTIKDGAQDIFPDTWNRFKEDIKNLKELGCNSFRLSIEWARLEPEQGKFDDSAFRRYHEIFDCLKENGITPCVTLHHFVHPGWFQDLGGFENENNIPLFVNYALHAFEAFADRVQLWATFNEPTVYTFCSYLAGVHAPGKQMKFRLAGEVLRNILRTHCEVYNTLKETVKGKNGCMIGIVHHYTWFKPSGNSFLYLLTKFAAKWMTFWWGRDIVLKYFKSGRAKWKIPLFCGGGSINLTYRNGEKPPLDWWGINYYTRIQASWRLTPVAVKDEVMTEMNYTIYPKGLYQSIAAGSQLDVPIYITETGVADSLDDKRHLMIKGYTNEVLRALKHGYDVRGMFYWTLVDNFEWNLGYTVRFGLYEYNPEKGVDRQLRNNAKALQQIYRSWPEKLHDMYAFAREAEIDSFEKVTAEFLAQSKQKT